MDFFVLLIIQIISIILCVLRWFFLKKQKQDFLYNHEIKSYTDTYKWLPIYIATNFVLWSILSLLISIKDASSDKKYIYTIRYYLVGITIVYLLALIYTLALSLYLVTEIKHLSPTDGIGEKIYMTKTEKAQGFFFGGASIGIMVVITAIYQAFHIHMIIGFVSITMFLFLYVFGMSDVLQHEGYNSHEYSKWYKKQSLLEKFYVKNICRFFTDNEYRKKGIKVLRINTENIIKGFRNIRLSNT